MSSLEALESCFAVGPIIEKASYFFKAHGRFLKRQKVSGAVRDPEVAAKEHLQHNLNWQRLQRHLRPKAYVLLLGNPS